MLEDLRDKRNRATGPRYRAYRLEQIGLQYAYGESNVALKGIHITAL